MIIIAVVIGITTVNSNAVEEEYSIEEKYVFPVVPNTDEWKAFTTLAEKIEATQIPEDILSRLTDEALIETILDYPLAINMFVYNTHSDGYNQVRTQFNGLPELENRGIANILYSTYVNLNNLPEIRNLSYEDRRWKEMILELLLSQLPYYNYLTEDNALNLIEIAQQRVKNAEPTVLFYDLFSNAELMTRDYGMCIYTPKGSAVDVTRTTYEMPQVDIDNHNKHLDADYPNATRIASATRHYNCHSYAWYWQSTSNTIWMDYPDKYMSDGSYTKTPVAGVGYRMYYPGGSTGTHSAVIIGSSGRSVTVKSKWANGGLYIHYYDDCPYDSYGVEIYR